MDRTPIPQTLQVHNQTIHLPPTPKSMPSLCPSSDNDINILQGYKTVESPPSFSVHSPNSDGVHLHPSTPPAMTLI